MNAIPFPVSVFSAIRDSKGRIVDFDIIFVNDAACKSNGLRKDQQVGHTLYDTFPNLSEDLRKAHASVTETGKPISFVQNTYRSPLGKGRPVITFDINFVKTGDGFTAIWRDTSQEREDMMELAFQSERDPLTGLVNRIALFRTLDDTISEANRYNSPAAVLFIDLDGFKKLNDSEGHKAGDDALVKVARIVRDRTRETDIAARSGGDEMVIVLRHSDTEEAMIVAEDIRRLIEKEFAGRAHPITASIGVTQIKPYAALDSEIVFHIADDMMYEAKKEGGNMVRIAGGAPEEGDRVMAPIRRVTDEG